MAKEAKLRSSQGAGDAFEVEILWRYEEDLLDVG